MTELTPEHEQPNEQTQKLIETARQIDLILNPQDSSDERKVGFALSIFILDSDEPPSYVSNVDQAKALDVFRAHILADQITSILGDDDSLEDPEASTP